MTVKLVIPGRLPGANEYIAICRENPKAANRMKKQEQAKILLFAKQQMRRWKQSESPVIIHYHWIEKDRRRDMDNIAFGKKFVQDALVEGKYLKGDGWQHIVGFTDSFSVDKKNPRIEVEIVEVDTCGT